jgi:O-antigen ligase
MVFFFQVAIEAFLQWSKRQHTMLPKWVLVFVLIGSPVVIVFTLTRGNWVGFLAGLWMCGLLGRKLLVRRQKLAMVGLLIGLVPIGIVAGQALLETSVIGERATRISTIETRLRTYGLVVEAARKNPLFGIGLNNVRDYLRERSRNVDGRVLGTAHNSYLAVVSELGIFALAAYLGIMWSIYRVGFRMFRAEGDITARWRGMAAIAMLTAYLVPGLFTHLVYGQLFAHIYLFACLGAIVGRYGSFEFRPSLVTAPIRINEPLNPGLIAGK